MSYRTRLAWREQAPGAGVGLTHWLRDRGSLTARLQTRGGFSLLVLRQRLALPTRDEAVALGVKRDRLLWVREVALCVDQRPLVFAHTVLPYRPRGPLTGALARLGRRSLGALLFSHPRYSRGPLRFQRLDARHALFAPALAALQLDVAPAVFWARRSRFSYGRQTVLVSEVFAPELGQDSGVRNAPEAPRK